MSLLLLGIRNPMIEEFLGIPRIIPRNNFLGIPSNKLILSQFVILGNSTNCDKMQCEEIQEEENGISEIAIN